MNKILKNGTAAAEISTLGAELISFRMLKDDCEYMWSGDKTYWGGHSPVLFPIVCAVNEGKIRVDQKEYQIGNHGFARKSEFTIVNETESSITFRLTDNEETLKSYPYRFELDLIYTLIDNKLNIKYIVRNTDNKEIYFQLGTHPGFNCPLGKEGSLEDYFIEFKCRENLNRLYMNGANVLIRNKSKSILQDDDVLWLTRELFEDGALVFRNINSEKVSLKSRTTSKKVVLYIENMPNLGIWQAKDAPFVCIEPWHGIADTEDFEGEFKEKEMITSLEPGKTFECSLTIEID
jgi:galactose mutarotase-like enzyme